jgi:hypothetical protein
MRNPLRRMHDGDMRGLFSNLRSTVMITLIQRDLKKFVNCYYATLSSILTPYSLLEYPYGHRGLATVRGGCKRAG